MPVGRLVVRETPSAGRGLFPARGVPPNLGSQVGKYVAPVVALTLLAVFTDVNVDRVGFLLIGAAPIVAANVLIRRKPVPVQRSYERRSSSDTVPVPQGNVTGGIRDFLVAPRIAAPRERVAVLGPHGFAARSPRSSESGEVGTNTSPVGSGGQPGIRMVRDISLCGHRRGRGCF